MEQEAGHTHRSRLEGRSLGVPKQGTNAAASYLGQPLGSDIGSFLSTHQAESMPHPRLEPGGSQPQVARTVAHGRMLSWRRLVPF